MPEKNLDTTVVAGLVRCAAGDRRSWERLVDQFARQAS